MTAVEQIRSLLENEERTPEKDGAGVITPAGYEAAIRAEAYRVALRVVEAESVINANKGPQLLQETIDA